MPVHDNYSKLFISVLCLTHAPSLLMMYLKTRRKEVCYFLTHHILRVHYIYIKNVQCKRCRVILGRILRRSKCDLHTSKCSSSLQGSEPVY